jgi:4'-phosphopantetheinyl transferase
MARYHRYLAPDAARTFLAARVLLRSLLSRYGSLSPTAWRFLANPWGRPYLANEETLPGLRFNLSHKPGFVTCLLGCDRELGVDVEDRTVERHHLLAIAQRFFSPAEVRDLMELPQLQQPERFYELWTLKESYIKARGVGLGLGLSKFSFTVRGNTARVQFDPGFPDDAARWSFQLFRPDGEHIMATSLERVGSEAAVIEKGDGNDVVRRGIEMA